MIIFKYNKKNMFDITNKNNRYGRYSFFLFIITFFILTKGFNFDRDKNSDDKINKLRNELNEAENKYKQSRQKVEEKKTKLNDFKLQELINAQNELEKAEAEAKKNLTIFELKQTELQTAINESENKPNISVPATESSSTNVKYTLPIIPPLNISTNGPNIEVKNTVVSDNLNNPPIFTVIGSKDPNDKEVTTQNSESSIVNEQNNLQVDKSPTGGTHSVTGKPDILVKTTGGNGINSGGEVNGSKTSIKTISSELNPVKGGINGNFSNLQTNLNGGNIAAFDNTPESKSENIKNINALLGNIDSKDFKSNKNNSILNEKIETASMGNFLFYIKNFYF